MNLARPSWRHHAGRGARLLALLAAAGACGGGSHAVTGTATTGQPCAKGSECVSGICEPTGTAGVCSAGCQSAASCPAGWTCGPEAGQAGSVCHCAASPEICDGLDNDCNGVVDDEPAVDQACAQQAAGQACRAGVCSCPSGQVICTGACIDDQSDPNNCGACGVACVGTCSAGHCLVTLASGQGSPFGLAIDAVNVYFTNYGASGTVMKVPITGGTTTLLASGQDVPSGVAVDATSVYWATENGGTIMKVAIAGGAPTMLAGGLASPTNVAVDATSVYWTESDGDRVAKVPIGGGTVTLISEVSFQSPLGIAVDATRLYWTYSNPGGAVVSAPKAGGLVFVIANQDWAHAIALDGQNVYWSSEYGDDDVMTAPLSGGPSTTLASNQGGPESLAVDATNVYWTNVEGGTVVEMLKASGAITVLASGQAFPTTLAVDATSVYWTNEGTNTGVPDGTVMKTAK